MGQLANGNVTPSDIRVEFQARGRPDIRSFIRIGEPKLLMENIEKAIECVDGRISTALPAPESDAELYESVKIYKVHHHSKSCMKYKNDKFWFNFGQFFTDRTKIAYPLRTDLTYSKRTDTLKKRNEILKVVSEYIQE